VAHFLIPLSVTFVIINVGDVAKYGWTANIINNIAIALIVSLTTSAALWIVGA
jgi:hypothetical protein